VAAKVIQAGFPETDQVGLARFVVDEKAVGEPSTTDTEETEAVAVAGVTVSVNADEPIAAARAG
jgi:hypothetical protein